MLESLAPFLEKLLPLLAPSLRRLLRFVVWLFYLTTPKKAPSGYRDKLSRESRAFLRVFDLLQAQPVRSLPWLRLKISTGTLIQDETPGVIRQDVVISNSLFGLGPLWGAWYTKADDADHSTKDRAVILYFHGGGFSTGSVQSHDGVLRRLCAISGQRIFSVEYHRCPELGYEGIIDEAGAAYTWLIEQRGYDPKHIFLCGDSAGGNIALSLPWKHRKWPKPGGIIAISPVVDLQGSYRPQHNRDPMLTRWMSDSFHEYLKMSPEDMVKNSIMNEADLSFLPPTMIMYSDTELLYEEITKFSKNFKNQSNLNLRLYPHLPHAGTFCYLYMPESLAALHDISAWISERLSHK